MTKKTQTPHQFAPQFSPEGKPTDGLAEKRAAALRENLKRRKDQQKARDIKDKESEKA